MLTAKEVGNLVSCNRSFSDAASEAGDVVNLLDTGKTWTMKGEVAAVDVPFEEICQINRYLFA